MSSDPTATLFSLKAEFRVLDLRRSAAAAVRVVVKKTARKRLCPDYGVLSATIKDRLPRRIKNLPASGHCRVLLVFSTARR